ncbi:MAG: hypothetical protein AAFY56_16450 [Pseudomonadota bacterium]
MNFAPLVGLLGLVSDAWFVTVVSAVFLASSSYFYLGLGKAKDRQVIQRFLSGPRGWQVYSDIVSVILDRIDRWLTPGNIAQTPKPYAGLSLLRNSAWYLTPRATSPGAAIAIGRSPWGWKLSDFALLLAVAYPIGFLVFSWALTGEVGRIGDVTIFQPNPPTWQKIATLGGLCAMAIPQIATPFIVRLALYVIALGLLFSVPGVGGMVVAVVVATTGAFSGTFAVTTVVMITAAVTVTAVVPAAIPVAVTCAFAFAFAGTGAVVMATRRDRGPFGYGIFAGGLILQLFVVSWLLGSFETRDPAGVLPISLIFLGVLPLLNAIFDYFSIGLTRLLIRTGAKHRHWAAALGLLDLLAAGAFFTMLGLSIIACVHVMNELAGQHLVDLQSLFNDLRDPEQRNNYWWLYAIIFTTLLPTILHTAISVWSIGALEHWSIGALEHWSIGALVPSGFRKWVLRLFSQVEEFELARWQACFGLSVMSTISLVAPLIVLVWGFQLLYAAAPWIGGGYLNIFEGFARWIGAAVVPGPLFIDV